MRRSCALEFSVGGGICGLLVGLLSGLAPWVDVVEAAIGSAVHENGAVELRGQSEDIECREGVNRIVWSRHPGQRKEMHNWI